MLAPFGPLKRLVLPPTKTVALCEYQAPPDARAALRGLAYRRLGHVPLYLEWAPAGAFVEGAPTLMDRKEGEGEEEGGGGAVAAAAAAVDDDGDGLSLSSSSKKQRKADAVAAAAAASAASAVAEEAAAGSGAAAAAPASSSTTRTLFVKNLSFATDDAGLRRHFEALLRSPAMPRKFSSSAAATVLRSARVARKKAPATASSSKQPPALLSAGYGFVELESEEAAAAVLALCNSSSGRGGKAPPLPRLDGHALVVEPASASSAASASASASTKAARSKKDDTRTKLAVLNLAFQATRSDLVALFSPFGAVRSCRVPKRAAASLDGSHRGYAFVDFASHGEAASALEGLSGTHLYGRRLALQWAEEDAPDASAPGGMEALTARAAKRSRAVVVGSDGSNGGGGGGGRSIKQQRLDNFDIE